MRGLTPPPILSGNPDNLLRLCKQTKAELVGFAATWGITLATSRGLFGQGDRLSRPWIE